MRSRRHQIAGTLLLFIFSTILGSCASPAEAPVTNTNHTVLPPGNNSAFAPEKPAETKEVQAELPSEIHPLSLEALARKEFNGSELKLGKVLAQTATYKRYYITYKSGDLIISGIMNVPTGDGPFPALILNHGHIDTAIYTNGRGLKREQDYFAKNGYIVLHTDYRNHAESGKDSRDDLAVRLGYIEDSINAVYALKNSDLPTLNKEKIGMLGHSMGGGVTLGVLVTKPELVQAAILYAPVKGDMRSSYERWISRRPEAAKKISDLYGDPTKSPDFWESISSETFFSRIKSPVHIFHGTKDDSVPLEWSEHTEQLLQDAGKDVTLTIYENEPHEFIKKWPEFMASSKTFFDTYLK